MIAVMCTLTQLSCADIGLLVGTYTSGWKLLADLHSVYLDQTSKRDIWSWFTVFAKSFQEKDEISVSVSDFILHHKKISDCSWVMESKLIFDYKWINVRQYGQWPVSWENMSDVWAKHIIRSFYF